MIRLGRLTVLLLATSTLAGCAATVAVLEAGPGTVDVVDRRDVPVDSTEDVIGLLHALKPRWFASKVQVLINQVPVPLDTVIPLRRQSINQISYFDRSAAASVYQEAGDVPVVNIVTVAAGPFRGQWRLVPLPLRPIGLEHRLQFGVGWSRLDSLMGPTIDVAYGGIFEGGAGVTVGVSFSTREFDRQFRDGMVVRPVLRVRSLYVEPRFYFRATEDTWRPFVGGRLLAANWRTSLVHPSELQPIFVNHQGPGVGAIVGMTVNYRDPLRFELSADYTRLWMGLFVRGNPPYTLIQPVRATGRIPRIRAAIAVRW